MEEINFNPTNTKVTGYGGIRLKVKGKCDVQCRYKDSRYVASFYIVHTESPSVVGCQTYIDLGLIKLVKSLSTSSEVHRILQKYSCVFKGLGCLREPYCIKINKSVNPVCDTSTKKDSSSTDGQDKSNLGSDGKKWRSSEKLMILHNGSTPWSQLKNQILTS